MRGRLGQRGLGALARLVDTSLVVAEARGDVTRYRLLETVRQYAAERLRAAGEEPAIRSRHCAWYVEFAEARDPEVPTSVVEVVPGEPRRRARQPARRSGLGTGT